MHIFNLKCFHYIIWAEKCLTIFCNLGVSFLFLKIDVYNLPNGQDSKLKTINIKLHEGYASNYQNMPIDNLNKLSPNRLLRKKVLC